MKEIAGQKEVIEDYIKKSREENNLRLEKLKKEKLRINQRLVKLKQLKDKKIKWMLSHLPSKKVANEVSNEIDKLLNEIDVLKEKLTHIEFKIQEINLEDINTETVTKFLQNFIERFEELETGEKKLLIQTIVRRIEVYNKNKILVKLALPVPPQIKEKDKSEFCNSSFVSSSHQAARPGFEPGILGPEPSVLPITPPGRK